MMRPTQFARRRSRRTGRSSTRLWTRSWRRRRSTASSSTIWSRSTRASRRRTRGPRRSRSRRRLQARLFPPSPYTFACSMGTRVKELLGIPYLDLHPRPFTTSAIDMRLFRASESPQNPNVEFRRRVGHRPLATSNSAEFPLPSLRRPPARLPRRGPGRRAIRHFCDESAAYCSRAERERRHRQVPQEESCRRGSCSRADSASRRISTLGRWRRHDHDAAVTPSS